MTLKAVFFDLDGTLLDTALDLSAALNHILIEDGRPELPIEETRGIVSEGSYALVKKGYGLKDHDPEVEPLRQRLLDFYEHNLNKHTEPFSGIAELIKKINDASIIWGVVTNKPKLYAEPLMAQFDFASTPSCVLAPEHVKHRKPHPESLILACELSGCSVSEAIYIGDHKRDIDCGKNAGMTTIAVSYGYIPDGEDIHSWQADHYVDSADELWPLISYYLLPRAY